MISIPLLFSKVLMLLLLLLPGVLLAKFGLATEKLGKGLANIILYAAQPALIIMAYNCDFSMEILVRALMVLLFSVIVHILYTVAAFVCYRKAPDAVKKVLQFATIFTNAGFMGIPLIEALYSDMDRNVGIYASIYIIVFNIFCWSVGAYIYSDDKKYISPRKMFLNPAVVATLFGFVLFFTPLNEWLSGDTLFAGVVYDIMRSLKELVAPLSMMLIGLRLAEIKWKGVLLDRYMYLCYAIRMILFPVLTWGLVKTFALLGIYNDMTAMTVMLLSASAPIATATSMFAEKFDGDAVYAGKIVSISTLLSVLTMPLVALLLYI